MVKVFRNNNKNPTPYLRKWVPTLNLKRHMRVLDLGCGNGRNSKFLKKYCDSVTSFDFKGDYGTKLDIINDKIPFRGKADVILCNYVMCFLMPIERWYLANKIEELSRDKCFLIIEMYNGVNSIPYRITDIIAMFHGWIVIHNNKDRCILRK